MNYYRPKAELTGKRLYAHTIAAFMVAQGSDDPGELKKNQPMPAELIRFLLRDSTIGYWTNKKNGWLKMNDSRKEIHLTDNGLLKVQDRLNGKAKAQSVTLEQITEALHLIKGILKSEPVDQFRTGFTPNTKDEQGLPTPTIAVDTPNIDPAIAQSDLPNYPDELPPNSTYPEGLAKQVLINQYERSNDARRRCISHYKAVCQVCRVNFETLYGEVGRGFIHVHHLVPIATVGAQYQIDPVKDLRPVCPNCHAMLHRRDPPFTIEELRAMMGKS